MMNQTEPTPKSPSRYRWTLQTLGLLVVVGLAVLVVTALREGSAAQQLWSSDRFMLSTEPGWLMSKMPYSWQTWIKYRAGDEIRFAFENVVTIDSVQYGSDDEFSKADLAAVGRIHSLKSLDFSSSEITDQDLTFLEGLDTLENLNLERTSISDAGLVHLQGLRKLTHIQLWDTEVSDAGLRHLENLPELKSMDLSETAISDAGLAHLKGFVKLEILKLDAT